MKRYIFSDHTSECKRHFEQNSNNEWFVNCECWDKEKLLIYHDCDFILIELNKCHLHHYPHYDFVLDLLQRSLKDKSKITDFYKSRKSIDVNDTLYKYIQQDREFEKSTREVNYIYGAGPKKYSIVTRYPVIDSILNFEKKHKNYIKASEELQGLGYGNLLERLEELFFINYYHVDEKIIYKSIDQIINQFKNFSNENCKTR